MSCNKKTVEKLIYSRKTVCARRLIFVLTIAVNIIAKSIEVSFFFGIKYKFKEKIVAKTTFNEKAVRILSNLRLKTKDSMVLFLLTVCLKLLLYLLP